MKCYTDYPLFKTEISKKLKTREIDVIYYDGDKRCFFIWNKILFSIKSGYIYTKPKLETYKKFGCTLRKNLLTEKHLEKLNKSKRRFTIGNEFVSFKNVSTEKYIGFHRWFRILNCDDSNIYTDAFISFIYTKREFSNGN